MNIEYKNKKLEKECTIASVAEKRYGHKMAVKIQMRISEINAADSIETMVKYSIGRCHPLKGNYKGKYAVDLVNPFRLIFEQIGTEIQIVHILEIRDYH